MAKTFYKYQERDIDSQVNWADIGLGMSDMITDQVAVRTAKKEAYDDEVRAFNTYLDEHPTGDDENLASWTSAYSSDMQKKMLDNQRAFKNGMISERDNVTFTQNVKDGTKTIFDLSTEYQAEFKDKMARINSADPLNRSQELESFLMEQAESYDNYKTSKPIIDPKSGLVLMSMKRKDGTYETVSAANLRNRMKVKVDYFDSNTATTKIESELGGQVIGDYEAAKSRLKTGTVTDTDDKAIKDGFETALREQVASYLTTETNTSSVLTNDILFEDTFDKDGKLIEHKAVDYTFTYNKDEAASDPYKILLTVKGGGSGVPTPDFTTANGEKQRQAALEYLTRQTIEKIDVKVGKQVIAALGDKPQDNPWFAQNAQDKKKVDDGLKTWANNFTNAIFGADQVTTNNGLQYLAGGFGGFGANSFNKKGNLITQIDIKGNKKIFTMDGSRNALLSVVQSSGIPLEYQDRMVSYLVKFQAGRQPNGFDSNASSTYTNQEAPVVNTSGYDPLNPFGLKK